MEPVRKRESIAGWLVRSEVVVMTGVAPARRQQRLDARSEQQVAPRVCCATGAVDKVRQVHDSHARKKSAVRAKPLTDGEMYRSWILFEAGAAGSSCTSPGVKPRS